MGNFSADISKYDLVSAWYTSVWENGNLDAIDCFYSNNAGASPFDLLPEHSVTASEVREWITILRSFVTDIKVNIIHHVEQDDWFSAVMEIKCKRMDTQADVRTMQLISMRLENNRVAEVYRSFDWIRFFEQLGQLPKDTHALLLGGTVLR